MTGLQWVTRALRTLNAVAAEETPSAAEAADGLEIGNDWLDSLATQNFAIYFLLRTVVPLTANTASYTIGTGGAINIVRPADVEAANLIIATSPVATETPIDVFTDQEWKLIPQKTATATYPMGIYFDHGWVNGLATISPYPIPNANTSMAIYTAQALTQMVAGVDVTFPPGYRRFLNYGLARELAASGFGGWDGGKEVIYTSARSDVMARNLRMEELLIDPMFAGRGGKSNIYTGTV